MASSQSSVGGDGSQKFKIDKGSPLWRHTTRISQIPGGGGFVWKCNFCNAQYNSSYYRVKLHFMGPGGKGINMCVGPDKKGLSTVQIAGFIKEQEDADNSIARGKQTSYSSGKKKQTLPTHQIVRPSRHPFLSIPSTEEEDEEPETTTRKRGPLEKAFKMEARDIAEEKIARCLYANGLPFNLVRSPYWKDMVSAINSAPPDFTSPGYEKVRTTLLQKERKYVEAQLKPIRDSWVETGVSIVSDGWKDCKNRPLINVIAVSPKGAMFLRAVDCEGEVKDAVFISRILIDSIEMVGSENVVQVVTDNAKVCRAAGALVEARYEHIFWTPCTVHSLNLVMQAIGTQIEWVKEIYQESEEIQMFVTNHHMSQAIFRTFSTLELLKVAETRFASHTIVLRRLVKVKDALSQMVISNQWGIWKQSNSERAQKVKALILNDDWWDRVNYVLEFTEPIMSMLRFADTDEPCLGDVYDSMDTMLEKIKIEIQKKENDPEDTLYKRVEAIVLHRWNKMTTPLHLLAYALSPRYYTTEVLSIPGRIPPYRDAEVANGYKTAFSRMFSDPEVHASVMREFGMFVTGKSKNHTASVARDQYKMDGLTWWYLHGQDYMYLQPLAIKILSQVASSSAAERNWSTYSFIHSVKRNRLAAKRAEDLVYIHSNLRLLSRKDPQYRQGAARLWDVAPESTDLDATIQDLARATMDDVGDIDDISHGVGSALGSNDDDFEVETTQNPSHDDSDNPFDD